jgi:hypothetical protein
MVRRVALALAVSAGAVVAMAGCAPVPPKSTAPTHPTGSTLPPLNTVPPTIAAPPATIVITTTIPPKK